MAELTSLGRYKLVRVLGRGAMGVVYEGLDPALNRRVAVKTILRNAAIDEETARAYSAQFSREAQAAGRLNHPNIVQVHDFAVEGEVAYLVMEYIQGRELRSFFEAKEKFTIEESVRIMGELLDALDLAHEAGVIHRDIKPANVMLDAQRRVKLADFGVARIQDSERSAAGTMVGTPAFMSPEQIQGAKIDRRTDIFSAGVVLYQLLTGEQPFTGAGAWTVAKKIMQDDPLPPSGMVKSVSPVFDGIVNKALAKIPAERYANAREFAAALRGASGAAQPAATATLPPGQSTAGKQGAKASEAEVEFWRAIQNSSDAAEFEFYLEQFPDGTYASLARHKIAKLKEPADAGRKAAEERERQEAEAREAGRRREEAEEQARIKAEAEALAKAQAEEARVRREAEERARKEAETRARVEAEVKAQREAAEKAKREAAEKAKRAAEEKARQAAALAKLKQQEAASAQADPDATVAISRPAAPAAAATGEKKKSFLVPAIAGISVAIAGAVAFFAMNRAPTPAPVAEAPAEPVKPAAPVVDEAKIRREIEDRLRREFADKSAAEQAAAKAAAEKAIAEKIQAAKAAEKAALERAAADKLKAEKLAAATSAGEKAAREKAAAEKAAADKAAQEKAVADKAAAEKQAAEKQAAEKAAAEKALARAPPPAAGSRGGLPAVGDQWVYEVTNSRRPDQRNQVTMEVRSVSAGAIGEVIHRPNGQTAEVLHRPGALLVGIGPGNASFSPFLHVQQPLRAGETWTGVEFRNLGPCSNNPAISCQASARVVGRERVSVKAGSFDAWKVVVDVNVKMNTRGTVEFTYWYADEVKRVVKYHSRGRHAGWVEPDIDLQLLSYTPAGAKPAARPAEVAAAKPVPETPAPVAPAEAAPAAPAQVASVAPAAARKPGWPVAGDRWTYEARQVGKPENSPHTLIEATSVAPTVVRDMIRGGNGKEIEHKAVPALISLGRGITSFSPYIGAFEPLREGQRWTSVDYSAIGGSCSSDPGFVCAASARVAGRERVAVKAGSYNAWKIVVTVAARGGASRSEREIIYWFAEEVNRFVKIQDRTTYASNWRYTDWDVELLSYAPARN